MIRKRIRFYTKSNSHFDIADFYVIDGLSSDVNISKTAMSALDVKWQFKEDYIIINGTKIPLISSSRSTGLLGMTTTNPYKKQLNNIPYIDIVKKMAFRYTRSYLPKFLQIPQNR